MTQPVAIDLFCGLGGWTEGLLAEGYYVVGFDNERHDYGDDQRYPAQLVIQDVRTLHGAQFKNAALIVASPPCQEYSYMAMPFSLGKAKAAEYRSGKRDVKKLTELFDACFRIQREACEAAGHHIPMVVENVRGAQPWVGRSRWNFGSFHLWGDVPALMPMTGQRRAMKHGIAHRADGSTNFHGYGDNAVKVGGISFSGYGTPGYKGQSFNGTAEKRLRESEGRKNNGGSWFNIGSPGQTETNKNPVHELAGRKGSGTWFGDYAAMKDGVKQGGDWFNADQPSISRMHSSKSNARKAASAMIAKIPLPLSRHIARAWKPS